MREKLDQKKKKLLNPALDKLEKERAKNVVGKRGSTPVPVCAAAGVASVADVVVVVVVTTTL